MRISIEDIELIAEQSQIILSEDEKTKAVEDLTATLEYIRNLPKLDLGGVEPTVQVLPLKDIYREDKVYPSVDRELVLKNAPHATDDSFVVPKIVE